MKTTSQNTLDKLNWTNRFQNQLGDDFYVRQSVQPLQGSHLIAVSESAKLLLGNDLDSDLEALNGRRIPLGADPLSSVYAGHQFGHYVPRLGDGRAILLGEIQNAQGEFWELQFKGSGLTPFSRMGDGKAVLRSSIREFLMSEHMEALGVPTTRALSLCASDEDVYRETVEKGALVLRLSPSFIRFGHFEYFYHRGEQHQLRELMDFVLENLYPELRDESNRDFLLLAEICRRTARTIARWMALGWSHGVMNTDNMSILGLTIDYGPFGFVEDFDPNFICNHSDHQGRYRLGAQARIGMWNCNALAWTFSPFLSRVDLERALAEYERSFRSEWNRLNGQKLGVDLSRHPESADELLKLLEHQGVDWTLFWRTWSERENDLGSLKPLFGDFGAFENWHRDFQKQFPESAESSGGDRQKQLCAVNPKYILRNNVAQKAIEQAELGEFMELTKVLSIMQNPFDDQPEFSDYAKPSPLESRTLQISCSS